MTECALSCVAVDCNVIAHCVVVRLIAKLVHACLVLRCTVTLVRPCHVFCSTVSFTRCVCVFSLVLRLIVTLLRVVLCCV